MSSKAAAVITILVVCLFSTQVKPARILGVFPSMAQSHYILASSLMKGLAEKGHDVTLISPREEKDLPKNGSFRSVVLTGFLEKAEALRSRMNFFDRAKSSPFQELLSITSRMSLVTEESLKHENVQNLINSGEKFDLVIVEQFFNDAHKALATHFGAHLVIFSPVGTTTPVNFMTGNPTNLAYIPDFTLHATNLKLSFSERLYNVAIYLFQLAMLHTKVYPEHDRMIKRYIPEGPKLEDVLHNASLVLLNSHVSLNQPVPYVPGLIDVAGFHLKKKTQKLPKDLQEFLDGAEHGVVYFSMGSNLKSSNMDANKRGALLRAFAKLPQKVLWKWEEDVLPGQPANVKLGKWLPQQEILAHPNVKVFITHGGFLSTTETVCHGVPILAIPIFGDQKTNALNAVRGGFGRLLDYHDITEEKLSENLDELLNNPKYASNAKTKSSLFHDRPQSPMETAVYWIEHVIRHGGTPHLRVGALDVAWYQYFLLDIIAFLALAALPILYVNYLILKTIWSKCGKKQKIKTQ